VLEVQVLEVLVLEEPIEDRFVKHSQKNGKIFTGVGGTGVGGYTHKIIFKKRCIVNTVIHTTGVGGTGVGGIGVGDCWDKTKNNNKTINSETHTTPIRKNRIQIK
jgi:hypothetical protein